MAAVPIVTSQCWRTRALSKSYVANSRCITMQVHEPSQPIIRNDAYAAWQWRQYGGCVARFHHQVKTLKQTHEARPSVNNRISNLLLEVKRNWVGKIIFDILPITLLLKTSSPLNCTLILIFDKVSLRFYLSQRWPIMPRINSMSHSIDTLLLCFVVVTLSPLGRFMKYIQPYTRDHFVYAPSPWETTLQCNVVSHWLGASTERSLIYLQYTPEDNLTGIGAICDVIMSAIASQIIDVSIVYSTVCSCAGQRKHQNSASLAFVRGIPRWWDTGLCVRRINRWQVDSPHKGPVTRKMFPFDDVFMNTAFSQYQWSNSGGYAYSWPLHNHNKTWHNQTVCTLIFGTNYISPTS